MTEPRAKKTGPSAAKAEFITKAFTYGLKAVPFREGFFCNLWSP